MFEQSNMSFIMKKKFAICQQQIKCLNKTKMKNEMQANERSSQKG